MSFLAPFYLLLGAAAAVPLLLHLLRKRIATRVDFPAARYLARAEREHSRSLRLRNLLLMLLRVLLVLALALAAARPFVPSLGVGHGPSALAVVLDNSLSTTAVAGGTPVFSHLRAAARKLLRAATPGDRLWLVTADGRVRGGSSDVLLAEVARITPSEDAGDLPLAFRRAAAAVKGSALPSRMVAVATDGQATAWRFTARADVAAAVYVPGGAPPRNRAVLSLDAEPVRWTPRGTITARVDAADSVGYRFVIGSRTIARGTAARGEPLQVHVAPPERGWQALRIELEPDDYAADDVRWAAVWIGAPPAVTVDASAGTFVAAAVGSLIADGRAARGGDVAIVSADAASSLPALLLPPTDPVRLGAANRSLAKLGVPWRFGLADKSLNIARGDRMEGVEVSTRLRLTRAGTASSDTLATAGGEPWIVAGPGYVLTASALDPSATSFPVRASFVPWLADVLALRLGAPGADVSVPVVARPGAIVRLPAGADAIENASGGIRAVTGERIAAPAERGVWFVRRGSRRIGALVVNSPANESVLARESAERLGARLAGRTGMATSDQARWVRQAWSSGTSRPALGPLLIIALLLLAAETAALRSPRITAA